MEDLEDRRVFEDKLDLLLLHIYKKIHQTGKRFVIVPKEYNLHGLTDKILEHFKSKQDPKSIAHANQYTFSKKGKNIIIEKV